MYDRITFNDDGKDSRLRLPHQIAFNAKIMRLFEANDVYHIEMQLPDGTWQKVAEVIGDHTDACVTTNVYASACNIKTRWVYVGPKGGAQ